MDTRCTLLDKQLCELHDGCQASMSGIRIGDDWPQVIDVPQFLAVCFRRSDTLLSLLAIVEYLRHEEMANLVGYSCLLGLVKPNFADSQ